MHKKAATFSFALILSTTSFACGGDKADPGKSGTSPEPGKGAVDQKPPAPPTPPPAGHQVFQLYDNRALAHLQRGGGLVVLPGTPGISKYTRFGRPRAPFGEPGKVDDKAVGFAATQSTIDVPLSDDQAKGVAQVRARLKSPGAGKVTLFVNQKATPTAALTPGWQTVTFAVPAGSVRGGENNLRFAYVFGRASGATGKPQAFGPGQSGAAAVQWIQVGGEALGDDAATAFHDPADKSLVLPKGGALAYYVTVPKDGKLAGEASCAVSVQARAEEGAPIKGELAAASPAVDLAPLAGKVVRLELTAGADACKLRNVGLLVPGTAPKAERPARPKNVILWINDSLRRDRLRLHDPKTRPESPGYDAFAKDSTAFASAYVQGNESRASHASIWTGVVPYVHGMIKDGRKLDPKKFETLPKAMRRTPLFVAGISGNGYITTKMGFGDGWQSYRNNIHDGGGLSAADMVRHATEFLEKHGDKPFFLYVGTIDTHVSWHARKPWIDRYDPKPYAGPFLKVAGGQMIDAVAQGKKKINERDKERARALYDSNVSYGSEQFAKFIDLLKEKKLYDDTMIVMTADHGDEQWEHSRVGHGGSSRETLVGVPLIIHYPPLFPAGKIVHEGADTIDILPTLLDALGAEPSATTQGQSLVELAQGVGQGYPRPAFSTHYELHWVMRLGQWKIRGLGTSELFDLENDPLEEDNIAAKRPHEHRQLIDALSTFVAYQKDWKKPRWGVASNHLPGFSDDLEARLK
jgi:arylsulfatase A-like enzyme